MALRRLARSPRESLLWLLAGFALCQLVLAGALERWAPGARDPEFASRLRDLRCRRAEAPGRPLVVFLGSSRTALAVDAARLSVPAGGPGPVAFNFGLLGCGPTLQLVTLRRLLADGVRPDSLYVE